MIRRHFRLHVAAIYDADGHHLFAAAVDGENAGGTWRVSATLYLFAAQ